MTHYDTLRMPAQQQNVVLEGMELQLMAEHSQLEMACEAYPCNSAAPHTQSTHNRQQAALAW